MRVLGMYHGQSHRQIVHPERTTEALKPRDYPENKCDTCYDETDDSCI